ncbi:hypothetical protein HPB50_029002 [Hyalomma asiaticum]|nr:hypothetical protein HPB50_029002 [Hyalomma asiaticum]
MTSADPSLAADKRRVAELVTQGVASGAVRPLGTVPFTINQVEEAFRFMAYGKQTGKVVIQIRPEETFQNTAPALPITVEAVRRSYFYEHKSYVIVGGLGGFGLELAEWMVTRGCRKLLLVSRSGVRSGYQKLCLERWHRIGAEVRVSRTDVSSEDGVHQIVQRATAMGPVGGIFNLAMVLRDALIENQTAEMYEAAWKPKACGTQLLDEVSRHMCPHLDHFVVFSSFSCGRGNAGQTNYGYANSVAERVCERRFADGFPGIKDLSSTNASVTLGELGIDSLMSFDVRQLLERDCDLTLSAQEIRQLTITRLCEMDKQCLNTAAS